MRKETLFQVPPPRARQGETTTTRIDLGLFNQIAEIGRKCRLSNTEVLNTIVQDALPYVRLVEVPLYELQMESGEGGAT